MDYSTISVLVDFAGLVTAAAALLAILEMKKQRESSYKPELVLLPPRYLRVEGSAGFPPFVFGTDEEHPELLREPLLNPVLAECINVGAGAARDLRATWEFDYQQAIAKLSPLLEHHGLRIRFDHGSRRIEYEVNGELRIASFTTPQLSVSAPYLLPAGALESIFSIRLPSDFLLFFGLGLCCIPGQPMDGVSGVSVLSLPALRLRISYVDVGGSRRENEFELTLEFAMLVERTNSDGKRGLGHAACFGVASRVA